MRTVEWIDGRVRMIDQRKLPLDLVVVEFDDYRDVARAIQNMTIRGAPAIGAAAAFGLALAAQHSRATGSDGLLPPDSRIAILKEAPRGDPAATPTIRPSTWVAMSSARAIALKQASRIWWTLSPYMTLI